MEIRMTVSDLIEKLSQFRKDADIKVKIFPMANEPISLVISEEGITHLLTIPKENAKGAW